MDALTAFGLFSVTAMLVCYALEDHSAWFIFGFAIACVLGSVYGFLQGAWPFGVVEAIWSLVAFRRWLHKGDNFWLLIKAKNGVPTCTHFVSPVELETEILCGWR